MGVITICRHQGMTERNIHGDTARCPDCQTYFSVKQIETVEPNTRHDAIHQLRVMIEGNDYLIELLGKFDVSTIDLIYKDYMERSRINRKNQKKKE